VTKGTVHVEIIALFTTIDNNVEFFQNLHVLQVHVIIPFVEL